MTDAGSNNEKRDYKQELTNRLIERIEASRNATGAGLQWVSPWQACDQPPFNPVTGTRYKGINFISCMSAGFVDPRFMTYKNVVELAASSDKSLHVKRGEKGIPVFKAVQVDLANGNDAKSNEQGEEPSGTSKVPRQIWSLAYAGTVFNASQIEGIEPLEPRIFEFQPIEAAEQLVAAMKQKTLLKVEQIPQAKAAYVPSQHLIKISPPEKFVSSQAFYDVLLHELGHSTGHAMGRAMNGSFGTAKYALEELVAELSSVFVGAELGLPHNATSHENHAAYLDSWLAALKDDKNYIFKAAAMATKACGHQMEILAEYRLEMTAEKPEPVQAPSKQNGRSKKALELEM